MNQDSSRERVFGGGFARGRQRTHLARQVLNWLREHRQGGALSCLATQAGSEGRSPDAIRCRPWDTHWSTGTTRRSSRSATSSSRSAARSGRRRSASTRCGCRPASRGSSTTRWRPATRRSTSCSRAAAPSRWTARPSPSRAVTTSASIAEATRSVVAAARRPHVRRRRRKAAARVRRPPVPVTAVVGLHHVQVAAPPGCEERGARLLRRAARAPRDREAAAARRSRRLLVRGRGRESCTSASRIRSGRRRRRTRRLHVGSVAALEELAASLASAGVEVRWADDAEIPGQRRFHVSDPWGNRLELIATTSRVARSRCRVGRAPAAHAGRSLRAAHAPRRLADAARDCASAVAARHGVARTARSRRPAPTRRRHRVDDRHSHVTRSPIPCLQGTGVPLGDGWGDGWRARRSAGARRAPPQPTIRLPRRARSRPAGSLTACLRLELIGDSARGDDYAAVRLVRRGRPDRRRRRAGPRAVARRPLAARGRRRARRDARRRRARERDRARVRGAARARPDRGRDERRRRQRRGAPARGPERDRRHAAPLARPGRPERRARLLLTRRRHRRARDLPPARASSRHARPARRVPRDGRRAVRRGLRAGPDAEPVHALQRASSASTPSSPSPSAPVPTCSGPATTRASSSETGSG